MITLLQLGSELGNEFFPADSTTFSAAPVTGVHISELEDPTTYLEGGELLLTTGYPLRATPDALDEFVAALDQRGLAGLAIKLGRYIEELPPAMLASAEELGFPVVQVPDGVGFDEIINQILTEVLGRQAASMARGERAHAELLQLVLEGGGVQEVVDALPGQLAGEAEPDTVSVLHVDRTGTVTAAAGAALPPDLRPVLFDSDQLFRTTRFGHGVHRPLTGSRTSLLVASVAAQGDLGRMIAVRADRPWDGLDVITLERAATVAALVVTRELAVAAVERKYRGDLLRDVLIGRMAGEDVERMRKNRILIDGSDEEGLLLQIFTQDTFGPIFFEIIQRKGNEGFGEGNFQALFESIERDQIKRGVL